MELLEKTKLIQ